MAARRLPAPLHPGAVRGSPVRLLVDGRPVVAFAGEPVAAALLAAGRPILSRSFRFHRPRGLMCSTGQCGWCECRIDGRPSVRSCQIAAVDGLSVESEHAWPSVRHDVLGILDRAWRWIPPTFYHHRFLRPRRLRKRYLDVIRAFGGRGRIRPSVAGGTPIVRGTDTLSVDVAVVGGGPAGLTAAEAAAADGASVVVIEAEAAVGGPWGWREDPLPDGRPLDDLVAALRTSGVRLMTSATAVSLDEGGLHVLAPTALVDIRAGSVIVATGSHERLPTVPGNDRPGVMGARTVEWLIRRHGIVPGTRPVIVGSGPDVDRASTALRAAGAAVTAIPDLSALLSIDGGDRVTGIRVRGERGVERIAADLVVVGERIPSASLARAAQTLDASPAVVLVGAAAGRPIEDAAALQLAASAGRAAARRDLHAPASGSARDGGDGDGSKPETLPAHVAMGAMVCFCEDVRLGDLAREQAAGYAHPEMVKRRTGALTGPCQGKYCEAAVRAALGMPPAPASVPLPMPTQRPPARPIRLGDLVATERSSATGDDG